MNRVYELMVHPRGSSFACALDGANPELAQMEEARRSAAAPDDTATARPQHKVDRKRAGLVLAICAALAMVISAQWAAA